MVTKAEKKFLWQSADGKRWYVRRKGKYQRINAKPGTEAFDAEYWEILRGRVTPRTTWAALIEAYRNSDAWAAYKFRTRADYELCFDYILEKAGDRDMTKTTPRDAAAAQDANRHRVKFGNSVVSAMSVLAEHARVDLAWIKVNPFRGLAKRKVPEERKAPHIPWTDDAVAIFRAGATERERLVFELGLSSVQRPADWCGFTWSDYQEGRLALTQGKTGKALSLPVTAELAAVLDAARPAEAQGPILMAQGGTRMTYSGMAQLMLKARKRLGLEAYDLHALRYRGVMELAWAGCDDDEIMSYSGHHTKEMVIKYAGIARQQMRAETAAAKRGNRYGTKKEPDTGTDTH